MRRGIGAVRRAGTSSDGQARTRPASATASAFQSLVVSSSARRRQPLRATAPLRSAPAAAATATGAAAAQARPDGLAEEERVLAVRCHPALTPDRM